MTAQRVRTPGNNPETRIFCDGGDYARGGSPCQSLPVSDWDAREARKRAKAHGWTRVAGKDYCPQHVCEHGYVPGDHHYDRGTCGVDTSERKPSR